MKINKGEIILLDNKKEYICISTIINEKIKYIYLISNFKPIEIKFGKINNNEITIINDKNEKIKVLKLFQNKNDF